MGRKKLNRTRAEQLEQQRVRSNRYYRRNAGRLRKKRMERYYLDKNVSTMQKDTNI